ncbi:hypothetical protein [Leifsonia poae]|uniref:hypothetical protein n=1 Tax=Leifsonia poae TaxID=110933 RepID=UPI001CBDAEDA|nr:hypothetical protein [Leifsonia poae]
MIHWVPPRAAITDFTIYAQSGGAGDPAGRGLGSAANPVLVTTQVILWAPMIAVIVSFAREDARDSKLRRAESIATSDSPTP